MPASKEILQKNLAADAQEQVHSGPRGLHRAIPWLLVLVTVLVFFRVCADDFVWDDFVNIARNARLNPPSFHSVLYFWSHPFQFMYIPLTYSLWAGLAALAQVDNPDIGGVFLNPYIFHAANLLVHLIAVLAVYQLLWLLVGQRWAACAGALLFAIHPVQVEPVAWATGMKDLLSGALSIIALWQYVVFAGAAADHDNPSSRPGSKLHYAVGSLAFLMAMCAKPSAMMVPAVAFLIDRLMLQRKSRQIIVPLLPWCVLATACAIVSRWAQPAQEVDAGPLWARPFLAADALAFYLCKIAFPASLGILYDHAPRTILARHWFLLTWMMPVAVGVGAWLYRKHFPWLIAAAGIVLAGTAPVLGWFPFYFERYSLVADRYLYLAMVGPALALAGLVGTMRSKRTILTLCALWLLALGLRSFFQTSYWQDQVTLFRHALQVNPHSAMAYEALAEEALKNLQPIEAEALARKSILLDDQQGDGYVTLGAALAAQGREQEAAHAYEHACRNDPRNPIPISNLAAILINHGEVERPLALCRRAIELGPELANTHQALAVLWARQNRFEDALAEAQIAVQCDPSDVSSRITLGLVLARLGRRAEAIECFQIGLRLNPQSIVARAKLNELTR